MMPITFIQAPRRLTTLAALGIALTALLGVTLGSMAQDPPKLKAGSEAPSLDGLEIVSGESDAFNAALDAKVTVVEFWATWCGPCKKAIPHLNEMSRQYRAQGLQVVGISVDDKRSPVDPFVKGKGDAMGYLVGWDKEKSLSGSWMKAAGQEGIPCTFVVSNRKILWIGNPHDPKFESIVKLALSGRYDPEITPQAEKLFAAARGAARVGNFSEATQHYDKALELNPKVTFDAAIEKYRMIAEQQGDAEGAQAWATACIELYAGEPGELSELALFLATNPTLKQHDLATASAAAAKAVDASSGADPFALSAQARVLFLQGDTAAAYAAQHKAYRLAPPESKSLYKADLDGYKSARAKASVGG